jgi:hypothetical protein
MEYADYSSLIDNGLILALVLIVWRAYRELRALRANAEHPHLSDSISSSAA